MAGDGGPQGGGRPSAAAQIELGFAHGWARKRRLDLAADHLVKAIAIDPELEGARVELVKIHRAQQRWRDVIDAASDGLERFPNQSQLHKYLIEALTELDGHSAALARYRLTPTDTAPSDIASGEILACLVVRNERDRLPWFLREARRIGADRFFVVDNGSTDGTVDYLIDQPDVHVWKTDMSFNEGNFGSAWFEVLMSRYGVGHWLLMLDADEVLCFPGYEERPLADLCLSLDRRGMRAAGGLMIDMYSDTTISETRYRPGEDFLDHCPFFDARTVHESHSESGPFKNHTFHWGGVRRRVFGDDISYLISKVPLVKYGRTVVLAGGQHWTSHPSTRIAHDACAVLHFKYFSSFVDQAHREALRGEHSEGAIQYREYSRNLEQDPDLRLHDPAASVRFIDSSQLVERGLVSDTGLEAPPPPPPIARRSTDAEATPFWSVMVTVYDRLHHLERVLESVAVQSEPDMQIGVVCDGPDREVIAQIRRIAAGVVPETGAITVTELRKRVGHPEIFNECIDRAAGEWVHILHDDDWVRPGFYSALRPALAANPQVGAAMVRQELHSDSAGDPWSSPVERDTPGVVDDWFERLSTVCRVQFSAMTVRRDVYEELGGFRPQIGSAFDWEMWLRIAARHSLWFEPSPLVVVTRDGTAESDQLITDGRQIDDALRVLNLAAPTFPPERRRHLVNRSRERYALLGLDLARDQLRAGDAKGAVHNIRAALDASSSDVVIDTLQILLARVARSVS